MHCYHVNDITSEVRQTESHKELSSGRRCFCLRRLMFCLLSAEIQRGSDVAERPGLLPVRHARDGPRTQHYQAEGKRWNFYTRIIYWDSFSVSLHSLHSCFQVNYPVEAKKNLANFSVVLDTPEYNRVTELKSHMSNVSRCLHHFIEIWLFHLCHFFKLTRLSSFRWFTKPTARRKCLKSPPQPTRWTSREPSGPSSSRTKQVWRRCNLSTACFTPTDPVPLIIL